MENALLISLKVVVTALFLALFLSLILAWRVSNTHGKLEKILEWVTMLPIFFPPSAVGYGVLILFGKNGTIGRFLYKFFEMRLIFTWYAGVITTFIVIFPIIYKSIKSGFFSIDKSLKEASIELGATKFQRLIYVELPLIKRYIYTGVILAFGRGFGEFGAMVMVSGNIPEKTQTIPMALYSAVETGDYSEANAIMAVIILISMTSILIYNRVLKNEN
ncbi:MAG: ABC transporter permease subunit [Fusobacteriaceae bacterium]|nr:ABC transporter permease subunit [Fusobacteriaceae bacterium]